MGRTRPCGPLRPSGRSCPSGPAEDHPSGATCPSGASRHFPMNGEEIDQSEIIDRLSVGYTGGVARTLNLAVHTVRREAFVEAAQRLMESRGYEHMSNQGVAGELACPRGAVRIHF